MKEVDLSASNILKMYYITTLRHLHNDVSAQKSNSFHFLSLQYIGIRNRASVSTWNET